MNKTYKISLHGKEVIVEQLPNGKFKKPDFILKQKGIRSSRVPLKQTTEIWNIFRKPFKHGTIVQDIIAYEDGDKEICPSGLNIDGGRVPSEVTEERKYEKDKTKNQYKGNSFHESKTILTSSRDANVSGRYPAQLFLDGSISYTREQIDLENLDFLELVGIDSDVIKFMDNEKAIDYVCSHLDKFNVADLLDEQSGVSTSRPDYRK